MVPRVALALFAVTSGCAPVAVPVPAPPVEQSVPAGLSVAATLTRARAHDGRYISWLEHIIDDSQLAGLELTGSDGLAMADLDGDGHEDIVSVHESDTVYDGQPLGHVRIAWGSVDAVRWELTTLAAGSEVAAAEDVSLADVNGDGHIDVVVACELAHLIYFQNPGLAPRSARWQRSIIDVTRNRGSYIRAFLADFNGDGKPEVVAANKGAQNPDRSQQRLDTISLYHPPAQPLDGTGWREQVLGRVRIPINSQPIDLDRDGDLDVLGGSRGESRLILFENRGAFEFVERPIQIASATAPAITGFNMDYADLDGDGRLDIVVNDWPHQLVWLRQPASLSQPWTLFVIGAITPDTLVSVRLADIDNDGDLDAFTGAYSAGPRDVDGPDVTAQDPLGRISWFQNPGLASATERWIRHDVSRRKRGMYDMWLARDLDLDGDIDFVGTRGNSEPFDGVVWLEQVRSNEPRPALHPARALDSTQMPLPNEAPQP